MRFLDIKTDYAFKMLFGDEKNKSLLISFLNAMIEFPHQQKVQDLTIQDPYNPPLLQGMKITFVDVKARLDTGEQVLIEMQIVNHDGFEKRILYNACKSYSMQLVKGDQYHLLNPVIALNVLDFVMFEDNDNIINSFKLLDKKTLTQYSDDIELIFVELPKFQKSLNELEALQEEWIYFIKHAEKLQDIPEVLNPTIQQALHVVDQAGLSPEELEMVYKRQEFVAVIKGAEQLNFRKGMEKGVKQGIERGIKQGRQEGMEKGKQEGIEQGRQEGIEEGIEKGKQEGIEQGRQEGMEKGIEKGIEQEKIQIAQNMLAQGLDKDLIESVTGLSLQQIQNLSS